MGDSADVVVIGGGVVGTSVAWHLRAFGIERVVLLERQTLGAGSTSAAAGGIRTQFSDELNVLIALRSLEEFERMDGISFRRHGYLFLIDDIRDMDTFRAAITLQRLLGVPSRELSIPEVHDAIPQLDVAGLLGATFCSWDGHASPEAVVQWYARELPDIRQGVEATAIGVSGGRVTYVETNRGRIETDTVVCAAGVWSSEVARMANVEIPLAGEPRHMFFASQNGGVPANAPLTIDFSTGFYFHREGQGLAFGGREPTMEGLAPHVVRRLPVLAELPIHSSWWGYYEQSPDHNAIVGETAEPSRFFVATGFSGHGFQQAPAVGEHVAQLVVGEQPYLDLTPFALERFADGRARAETLVV